MRNSFKEDWKEFMKGRLSKTPPECLDRYELAKLFYNLGVMNFIYKQSSKKIAQKDDSESTL